MKKLLYLLVFTVLLACSEKKPEVFPQETLTEQFMSLDGSLVTFKAVLEKHKGKKIVFETSASWCSECVGGIPEINRIKAENPKVVYVYLSIDKTVEQWKKGIERFELKGEHYFLPNELKGGYATGLNITDIPNYMVVNELGLVSLANVIEATDPRLRAVLK